jgi:hypothetical protein
LLDSGLCLFGAGTMLLMVIEGKNLFTPTRRDGLYTLRSGQVHWPTTSQARLSVRHPICNVLPCLLSS